VPVIGGTNRHSIWDLARRQHGVVSRAQLLALGLTRHAIAHRVVRGRLFQIHRGVYAVGRPELGRHGLWMAAVLASPFPAAVGSWSAGALWEFQSPRPGPVHVVTRVRVERPGIVAHQRTAWNSSEITCRHGIPVTKPAITLIDIAATATDAQLHRAIGEADKLDLITVPKLRETIDATRQRPGLARLRNILDQATFVLTDSELERLMLPIIARAGLPNPVTRAMVNGYRVDFYFPELGLVIETDGLRFHRTPFQQRRDTERDNAHAASEIQRVRFTHWHVKHDPAYVERTLRVVAARLG
jgi:predicted transcriptional regulator of viral defense system